MDAFKLGGPFNIHDTGSAPDLPGLYVWYARFRVEEADWNSAFADGNDAARDRLLRAIRGHSLKFGRQEIRVRAEAHFSSVWKGVLSEDQSARWRSQDYASAEPDGFAAKISPAIDHDGIMDFDLHEAEFARTVLACGERRVVVSDGSKFGAKGFVTVCGFDAISELVTDRAPDRRLAAALKHAVVTVRLATD